MQNSNSGNRMPSIFSWWRQLCLALLRWGCTCVACSLGTPHSRVYRLGRVMARSIHKMAAQNTSTSTPMAQRLTGP